MTTYLVISALQLFCKYMKVRGEHVFCRTKWFYWIPIFVFHKTLIFLTTPRICAYSSREIKKITWKDTQPLLHVVNCAEQCKKQFYFLVIIVKSVLKCGRVIFCHKTDMELSIKNTENTHNSTVSRVTTDGKQVFGIQTRKRTGLLFWNSKFEQCAQKMYG